MTAQIQNKIQLLIQKLQNYNQAYYGEDQSLVSDQTFDALLKELETLEKEYPQYADPNSPTQRVGGAVLKKFLSFPHLFPMLSLPNTYEATEIQDFIDRTQKNLPQEKIEYTLELKYDGVAMSLHYEKGHFVRGLTRGDGVRGEDITENLRTINTIPLQLRGSDYPELLEIRGEVFFTKKAFTTLNAKREAAGEEPFANPRNAASGTLKLLDSKVVAKRGLSALCYGVYAENLPFSTHAENLNQASIWGFPTPSAQGRYFEKTEDLQAMMGFIHYWDDQREKLPFHIDGIVIKINDLQQQKKLGMTAKIPRWAIAFKYKAQQVSTILENVQYQVGRTGIVTPVAYLMPVLLAGTIVKRASLYNEEQMNKLGLRMGDRVFVEKGGEIIPKIVGIAQEAQGEPIQFTRYCPVCQTKLMLLDEKEGRLPSSYCPNEMGCPPQIKGKIEHFVSRRAMNIEGLGTETIDLFFEKGIIHTIADLYFIDPKDLAGLTGFAQKSMDNLFKSLDESKKVPFERVLFALGIRHVGETTAKKIARYFKNIYSLQAEITKVLAHPELLILKPKIGETQTDLLSVDEVGFVIAQSLVDYFKDPLSQQIIAQLQAAGLQFEVLEVQGQSDLFLNKTFVVSGTFEKFSRDAIKEKIEALGGKNASSISSKTNYVLAGENMGPAKLKKASDLGISIISERDFLNMINDEL